MTINMDMSGLDSGVCPFKMSFYYFLLYNAYILPTTDSYFPLLPPLSSAVLPAAVNDPHSQLPPCSQSFLLIPYVYSPDISYSFMRVIPTS